MEHGMHGTARIMHRHRDAQVELYTQDGPIDHNVRLQGQTHDRTGFDPCSHLHKQS